MPDEIVRSVTVSKTQENKFTVKPDNPHLATATVTTGQAAVTILCDLLKIDRAAEVPPVAPAAGVPKATSGAPAAASAPKKRKR